jgi:hypothetical protein
MLEQDSILRCLQDVFGLPSLGAREDAVQSICATDGSGMVDVNQTPIQVPTATPVPVPAMLAVASEDVVDGVKWLVRHLHREHEELEAEGPKLASRECLPGTRIRHVIYRRTGEEVDICANDIGSVILWPGDNGEDHDQPDKKQGKRQHGN